MLDLEGRIVSWNKGAQRIKGYSPEEIVGQHFSRFYSSVDIERGKPQQDLNIAIAKGRFEDKGCWRVRKDGSTFLANVIYTAIRDECGNLRGFTKLIQDMTERKRLDQLLKEKNAALETANKDLEAFAYSVSHDLRVPLRAIDGFSQQVLKRYEDKLDNEGKRYLNIVRDNTKKMSQLIDDILAFSRMGRLGLSVSEVNMEELVHAVFEELKPNLAERELTIEIKPLPLCHGDPSMLRQVLVNLLGNAIKFTRPKDAALIEMGGHTEGAENIYYIKDNGAGFDMQYADKLFGVFQRLHGVAEFEGTGIGLAIVKRIITRHGGRVWAEGKVDEGATFYFTLPD
jgi:two-component system sensor kinase